MRITVGPKVKIPDEWVDLLAGLRSAAQRQRLRWPTVTVTAHKWLKHKGKHIWASTDCKGTDNVRIRLRVDDAQVEHTMMHEVAHGIAHLACRLARKGKHDEHPPVFWAIHGMLYRTFIDGA